jgi:ubiquinone biosynthesis protein COQ9
VTDEALPPDEERDAALVAALPHVPRLGWTLAAVRAGLVESGGLAEDAAMLFPGGAGELVEAFVEQADRWMGADAAAADMAGLRTTGRVRAVIALRLARLRPHREAVRRAAGFLALPGQAPRALRLTKGTVDAIWHAAGDTLEDASRHTKRPLLAMVYASTLLVWLRDGTADDTLTLAFLDRRLGDVGRIGKWRAAAEKKLGNILGRKSSSA